jgi:flavin reductase (DIM6/NTAB) family NADH-FMN oxidoreductase RutF
MDKKAEIHALRMIPYGLYVLSAHPLNAEDGVYAATVSWLSQASFDPPRIEAGTQNELDALILTETGWHYGG